MPSLWLGKIIMSKIEAIICFFSMLFNNYPYSETFSALFCLLFGTIRYSKETWDEDARLIREFKDGNHDAYWRFFEKYCDRIYRYCFYFFSRLNDPEEHARVAMERVFDKLYENIYGIRKEGAVFSWLKRTAFTTCIDILKKEGRFIRIIEDEDEAETPCVGIKIGDIVGSGKTHDASLADKEIRKILGEALNALPEKYRLPVILRHYMDYSGREAANMLGCKEEDIKRWVHRGLLRLREILKPYSELIR